MGAGVLPWRSSAAAAGPQPLKVLTSLCNARLVSSMLQSMPGCKLVGLCHLTGQLRWLHPPLRCLQGEVDLAPSEGNAWDSGDGAGYRVTFFTANGCFSGTNSQVRALITSVLTCGCSMASVYKPNLPSASARPEGSFPWNQ